METNAGGQLVYHLPNRKCFGTDLFY